MRGPGKLLARQEVIVAFEGASRVEPLSNLADMCSYNA